MFYVFDVSKINGGKVIVKMFLVGIVFIIFDGVEWKLDKEDFMICDVEKFMCIVGVFGGMDSGVIENIISIFLESVYFNFVSIWKIVKRYVFNIDVFFWFERGIDFNIIEYVFMVVVIMMEEIVGGEISSDVVDIYFKKIEDY